ncbi:hypothetical protein PROFUN_02199 [Planoprotostelium fungivorum]|uniref:INO80 complex subunit B-like conserved region domain-containing protein n=1 Tax=Planoprotostelium fungivorum TaxID=1890364 RepID=A0A2P6NZC4_9EUKA|nr:hypothetical protein PROFUN_02199 [Planoprotostelium fungivorum]
MSGSGKLSIKLKLNGQTTGSHIVEAPTQSWTSRRQKKMRVESSSEEEDPSIQEEPEEMEEEEEIEDEEEEESSPLKPSKTTTAIEDQSEANSKDSMDSSSRDNVSDSRPVSSRRRKREAPVPEEDPSAQSFKPTRVSARQRLARGETTEDGVEDVGTMQDLLSLPLTRNYSKKKTKTKEETDEARAAKLQRRKEQSLRAVENEKNQAIEKLLNRGKKGKKNKSKAQPEEVQVEVVESVEQQNGEISEVVVTKTVPVAEVVKPLAYNRVRYVSNRQGSFLTVPSGLSLPFLKSS